jgi:hypothetical protein
VQGNSNMANLGATGGALSSDRKSLAILQALVALGTQELRHSTRAGGELGTDRRHAANVRRTRRRRQNYSSLR